MPIDSLAVAIALGLAAGGFVYAALSSRRTPPDARRALAVASFCIGGALSWALFKDPGLLDRVMSDVATRAIAILLAALAAAITFWKIRSFFTS